ncbi:Site-specific DNA recombinase [Jatrophihabitans endophyticus]|uniref:Site-specific DNA recombinase n=1 Tax=Jatrophihabitans endophyticus TaxID=1206085 RepID=A0A1M5TSG2_9ACTN|nr:recombinase family protein [Jatrophihabitans endophyticus]SHH53536.1 Site-specific DNA recombinase [Jatrophihabitans endophyticus]
MYMPRAAAIYARISKDVTGEALGVERQLDDCRRLARELGWTVVDEYIDNDLSAFSGKLRPEYRRMFDDVKTGLRDGILSYHTDRLTRQTRELEDLISLCDANRVAVQTVRAGSLNLSDASGRMTARIVGAVARGESERMSERMKAGNKQRAEKGRPDTRGYRKYGYERDHMTIREDEAAIIREFADRLLAGESLTALTRELNDRNVPTATGRGPWYSASLRQILRSARLSAQREYQGQIVALGEWPPILSREQTARIRHLLDDPARRTLRTPSRYLLSGGLLRCGTCGGSMSGRPKEHTPSYECRKIGHNCGRVSIKAEPMEDYARDLALTALDGPDLAASLRSLEQGTTQTATLTDQLAADEQRLDELAEAFADGEVTRTQLTTATKKLTARITANRDRLAADNGHRDLSRYLGQGIRLRRDWDTMTLDQRRAVITAVFEQLTISPVLRRGQRGFDTDRIGIVWRV